MDGGAHSLNSIIISTNLLFSIILPMQQEGTLIAHFTKHRMDYYMVLPCTEGSTLTVWFIHSIQKPMSILLFITLHRAMMLAEVHWVILSPMVREVFMALRTVIPMAELKIEQFISFLSKRILIPIYSNYLGVTVGIW